MGQSQAHPREQVNSSSKKSKYVDDPPTLAELHGLFTSTTSNMTINNSISPTDQHQNLLIFHPKPRSDHQNIDESQPSSRRPHEGTRDSRKAKLSSGNSTLGKGMSIGPDMLMDIEIYTYKTLGEKRLRSEVFRLMESGMKRMYETTSFGWSVQTKKHEMALPGMRFLTARPSRPLSSPSAPSSAESTSPKPTTSAKTTAPSTTARHVLGYLAFQVVEEPLNYVTIAEEKERQRKGEEEKEEEMVNVMYCWELHISPKAQRTGLGRHLMAILHHITKSLGLPEVRLTVFEKNIAARKLYESLGMQQVYAALQRSRRRLPYIPANPLAPLQDRNEKHISQEKRIKK